MNDLAMHSVLSQIEYPDTSFTLGGSAERGFYLQVSRWVRDTATLDMTIHKGRKFQLSEHMTKSEIVQTALMAVLAYEEHEVREAFTYKGQAIFGPHFDVDDIVTSIRQKQLRPDVRAQVVG